MTESEMVREIATRLNIPMTAVKSVIEEVGNIASGLRPGQEIRIGTLGKFEVTRAAPRLGRNPQTGAAINIPAKSVIKFKAAKPLTAALNA